MECTESKKERKTLIWVLELLRIKNSELESLAGFSDGVCNKFRMSDGESALTPGNSQPENDPQLSIVELLYDEVVKINKPMHIIGENLDHIGSYVS